MLREHLITTTTHFHPQQAIDVVAPFLAVPPFSRTTSILPGAGGHGRSSSRRGGDGNNGGPERAGDQGRAPGVDDPGQRGGGGGGGVLAD